MIEWFFQQAWRRSAGLPEFDLTRLPPFDELRRSEWSADFEGYMRRRLVMGAFRYGLFRDPAKGNYDCIASIIERAKRYQQDGNTEHLVDIANLAMVEFTHGKHPKQHFHAADDAIHVSPKE